ncbi:winged helix-turn-helix transcriptional regulator [Actinoplanes siamensis]|uniref:HxlR family transcriptional regulator n=1 Tax=Actinoplanes siamensis TaxID=1223317 RepID=A0A919N5L9_9ACTN|nr:helix-turn-helix domain-containing protein [Actinoplanes siamensis]GIF04771.1 HxlR family transcriptional regulator [Actinoplanes siamensis]
MLKILALVGDKWSLLVIGHVGQGPVRFGAPQRAVTGVSHRMLTVTLRQLERDGLVTRTVYACVPPRVEYALTTLGETLLPPVKALGSWAETNLEVITKNRRAFDAGAHTE